MPARLATLADTSSRSAVARESSSRVAMRAVASLSFHQTTTSVHAINVTAAAFQALNIATSHGSNVNHEREDDQPDQRSKEHAVARPVHTFIVTRRASRAAAVGWRRSCTRPSAASTRSTP